MPKKSVAARSGAQRQKPRTQKSFELVRSEAAEQESEDQLQSVPAAKSVSRVKDTPQQQDRTQAEPERATTSTATAVATQEAQTETKTKSEVAPTAKASTSTRVAARRQAAQKTQMRSPASLITAEHFAYVRRDLMIIATLAITMFAAIIVLYFVFGRGA